MIDRATIQKFETYRVWFWRRGQKFFLRSLGNSLGRRKIERVICFGRNDLIKLVPKNGSRNIKTDRQSVNWVAMEWKSTCDTKVHIYKPETRKRIFVVLNRYYWKLINQLNKPQPHKTHKQYHKKGILTAYHSCRLTLLLKGINSAANSIN